MCWWFSPPERRTAAESNRSGDQTAPHGHGAHAAPWELRTAARTSQLRLFLALRSEHRVELANAIQRESTARLAAVSTAKGELAGA